MDSQLLIVYILSLQSNAYYLSLNDLKWSNASKFCQSHCNSNLASIHTQTEYNQALTLITNNNYSYQSIWIGLNDRQTTDSYEWSDQTSFNFGSNTNGGIYPWYSSKPGFNNDLSCVAMEIEYDYQWNDRYININPFFHIFHILCLQQI